MNTSTRIFTIVPENINGTINGPYNKEEVVKVSFCYLHGDLQIQNGYDIFSLLKEELLPEEIDEDKWVSDELKEGIYHCICFDKKCTFFRWWNGRHFSGLVVLNSDIESYEYAKQNYEAKSPSI